MDLLRECYPENISQFAGNRFLVRKLYESASKGTHLLIFGPTGCGKTALCRIFQNTIQYQSVFEVNKDSFSSVKEVIANLKTFITSKTIESYFNRSKQKRRAIFLDDYDILVNTDKQLQLSLITEIFPLLVQDKNVQLLITCVTDYAIKKKIQESLKIIEIVKLSYPQPKEAFTYLLSALGDKIDGREEDLLGLLNKYKGCIRDAVMHLEAPNDTDVIGITFKDMNQFEIVKALFTKLIISKDDIKYILLNDVSNITYLLFENLPEEICLNRYCDTSADVYFSLLNYFTDTAEIETFAFNQSDWKLYDFANMMRMEMICQTLNRYKSKAGGVRKDSQLRFTQLLSKMSHRNIFFRRFENLRKKTLLNYDLIMKTVETADNGCFKKNTDESNILVTYKKYFSDNK